MSNGPFDYAYWVLMQIFFVGLPLAGLVAVLRGVIWLGQWVGGLF